MADNKNKSHVVLDKPDTTIPESTKPVNRITEYHLDSVIDGIVLNVDTEILGEPIREPDKTDSEGKVIARGKQKIDASGNKQYDFPKTKVSYKVDLTGTFLKSLFARAKNDITVEIGKRAKMAQLFPDVTDGLETVNKLNGMTLKYMDVHIIRQRIAKKIDIIAEAKRVLANNDVETLNKLRELLK